MIYPLHRPSDDGKFLVEPLFVVFCVFDFLSFYSSVSSSITLRVILDIIYIRFIDPQHMLSMPIFDATLRTDKLNFYDASDRSTNAANVQC
jgi:hypothetical protein